MCLPSKNIKFCTCIAGSSDQLKNYWKLYRMNVGKNLEIIGEIVQQEWNSDYFEMRDHLVNRLNDADAFDVVIDFEQDDVLEINVECKKEGNKKYYLYHFIFKGEKWMFYFKPDNVPFYIQNNFDEIDFGRIEKMINQ